MKTEYEEIPELSNLLNKYNDDNRKITSVVFNYLPPVISQNKIMENYLKELDRLLIYLIQSVELIKKWTHLTK